VIPNKTSDVEKEGEQLAPLFLPDVAKDFRSRWDAVQSSFVLIREHLMVCAD